MFCKPSSYEHFQCTPLYMIRNAGASELPVLLRMSILSFYRRRTPRPFAPNDEFSDQMKLSFLEQLYKKDNYIHNELTDKPCILFVVILVSSHLEPSTHYFDLSWRDVVKIKLPKSHHSLMHPIVTSYDVWCVTSRLVFPAIGVKIHVTTRPL